MRSLYKRIKKVVPDSYFSGHEVRLGVDMLRVR